MKKRNLVLASAVAGLIAAGSMARTTFVYADDEAAKPHDAQEKHDMKDGCGGKDGCMGKAAKAEGKTGECTCKHGKCKGDHCKKCRDGKCDHAKKHDK